MNPLGLVAETPNPTFLEIDPKRRAAVRGERDRQLRRQDLGRGQRLRHRSGLGQADPAEPAPVDGDTPLPPGAGPRAQAPAGRQLRRRQRGAVPGGRGRQAGRGQRRPAAHRQERPSRAPAGAASPGRDLQPRQPLRLRLRPGPGQGDGLPVRRRAPASCRPTSRRSRRSSRAPVPATWCFGPTESSPTSSTSSTPRSPRFAYDAGGRVAEGAADAVHAARLLRRPQPGAARSRFIPRANTCWSPTAATTASCCSSIDAATRHADLRRGPEHLRHHAGALRHGHARQTLRRRQPRLGQHPDPARARERPGQARRQRGEGARRRCARCFWRRSRPSSPGTRITPSSHSP